MIPTLQLGGLGRQISSVGSEYAGAHTAAIIAAFSVEPDSARKALIDGCVYAIESAGIWTILDGLWMLAAHDGTDALVNWINPGTHDATIHGTANPTFTTDVGYATDGVDNYISTNFNPATAGGNFAQNSACFGIWSNTSAGANPSAAGWFDGTDGITLVPRNATDTLITRINQAAITTSSVTNTDGSGLYAANRSAVSTQAIYKNGSSQAISGTNPAQSSTALNSANLRLGSITLASFRAFQFRAAFVGGSLNSTQHGNLYSALNAYMSGL